MKRALRLAAIMLAALPGVAFAEVGDGCETAYSPDPAWMTALAGEIFEQASADDVDAMIACFADPDPRVRDQSAFTLWSEGLRGNHLSPALLRHASGRLQAILAGPDDAAGFFKPFAALALAEVARTDRLAPWLSDAERHAIAASAAGYLRGVTDYRGFVPGEGWRHGVAHGADLALQLALNPRLARTDALLLLDAVAAQVAPDAPVFYHYGEPGRLARPILYLAMRDDIDEAAWRAWFAARAPDAAPRWQKPYDSDAALAAVHNSRAFAEAIYVAAAESANPKITRLAPLAADLLRALP